MSAEMLEFSWNAIETAIERLAAGRVVVYPSANVYGVLANAADPAAVARLYAVKQRSPDKPSSLYISPEKAPRYGRFTAESRLVLSLMPGPVTIIVPKTDAVPPEITPNEGVGMTCPDEKAWALANLAPFPIVCSSANKAGRAAVVDADGAKAEFGTDEEVSLIIDGGGSSRGAAGTIVDFTGERPLLRRTGPASVAELRRLLPRLEVAEDVTHQAVPGSGDGRGGRGPRFIRRLIARGG